MSRRAARGRSGVDWAEAAPVFAALGDRTRLELVGLLCAGGPQSITRLTENARVSRQAVTKHLHVLAGAGLAHGTRIGRDHVWEIESGRIEDAHRWLAHIERQWDEALGRLKAAVEG